VRPKFFIIQVFVVYPHYARNFSGTCMVLVGFIFMAFGFYHNPRAARRGPSSFPPRQVGSSRLCLKKNNLAFFFLALFFAQCRRGRGPFLVSWVPSVRAFLSTGLPAFTLSIGLVVVISLGLSHFGNPLRTVPSLCPRFAGEGEGSSGGCRPPHRAGRGSEASMV